MGLKTAEELSIAYEFDKISLNHKMSLASKNTLEHPIPHNKPWKWKLRYS